MKIYALLSWFDEAPEHLSRCVRSLKGFADVLVALDGAYATFPDAKAASPSRQAWALHDTARECGFAYSLKTPWRAWKGGEVEKRAALFELARFAGATAEDWFLIIDADMTLDNFSSVARDRLAATDLDVAEVCWHDVRINGEKSSTCKFRSMFRALPGLTVERTHYLYTVPEGDGRRFLWLSPDGHIAVEPALDLADVVTLHHCPSQRAGDRKMAAQTYYKDRDAAGLELVGDWHGAVWMPWFSSW